MLQPSQLQKMSVRYANEIAEVRDFFLQTALPLDSAQTLGELAARLREDRGFRRDLTSHIYVVLHSKDRQVSYSDLLGILTLAAAGTDFAASAQDREAHELLYFLMEARSSFVTLSPQTTEEGLAIRPAGPKAAPPVAPELFLRQTGDCKETPLSLGLSRQLGDHRRTLWIGAAAACLLAALFAALWLERQPSRDRGASAAAVTVGALGTTSPATAGNREAPQPAQPVETSPSRRQTSRRPPFAPRAASAHGLSRTQPYGVSQPVAPRSIASVPLPAHKSRTPATLSASVPTETVSNSGAPHRGITARPSEVPGSSSARIVKVGPLNTPEPAARAANTVSAHGGFVRPTSLGIMAANVTYSPAPVYPSAASDLHVQGEVKLEAEVGRDGSVLSTRIISGPPLLQEAAADALQRWRYRPYLYDGKPIAMNTTVVMDFQLP